MPLTRKAIVEQTIACKCTERVPIWVDGVQLTHSDVLTYDLSLSDPNNPKLSEWGFRRLKAADGSWIVPKEGTLTTWPQVDAYKIPNQDFERRFRFIPAAARVCQDRYRLASFGLSGYSVYCALRGAALCFDDCLRDFDRFGEFFDEILEFETSMFDTLMRKGFHGIEFCDDWGPRKTSRITLSLWRTLFRDRYAIQIKRAKELGLHVWFSVSEEGSEFFGDLREIGVDVVRVENPMHDEVASIGRRLRSKLCFATRVESLYTPEDGISSTNEIRNMRDTLGVLTGGFIATIGANASQETIQGIAEIINKFPSGINNKYHS